MPEDKLEKNSGAEVSVPEQLEIDDGIWVLPLPEDEGDEQDRGENGGGADEGIAEPVFFLAFIEEELEAADTGGDERETDEVDGIFFPWCVWPRAAGPRPCDWSARERRGRWAR